MTDFDKLDQQYRDEGWGRITDDALPGVRPSNVESQARSVATWCVGRISTLEAHLAEAAKERDEALEELGKVIMACPVGQRSMPISATVASMRARLSALEAAPPAPKVTEAMVERACKAWWPLHWPQHMAEKDMESIRQNMRKALTAAQESGE